MRGGRKVAVFFGGTTKKWSLDQKKTYQLEKKDDMAIFLVYSFHRNYMESNTRFLIIPQVSDQRVCLLDARVIRFRAVFRRVLTSRLNSPSSLLDWLSLSCDVDAVLERIEKVTQFTEFHVRAELTVPTGTDEAKAQRLLEKAKNGCLITNSMKGTEYLESVVHVATD